MEPNKITEVVIGCAIEVHRTLGPGLLESAYCDALAYELGRARLRFEREKFLPLLYKGVRLESNYRLDFIIENTVIVEVKSVPQLLSVFEYQLITYLKLTSCPIGLLMNFNVPVLKDGIRRKVWNLPEPSASPRLRV